MGRHGGGGHRSRGLGGSDAPAEVLGSDPELGSEVLGRTTNSEETATEDGIDPSGGENADVTTDGGPDVPDGAEPSLRDAATIAQQVNPADNARARGGPRPRTAVPAMPWKSLDDWRTLWHARP